MSLKQIFMVGFLLQGCASSMSVNQAATDMVSPGCSEVGLKIDGSATPVVGDEWDVYFRCDEAIIQGYLDISVTPSGFANIFGNTVVFTEAGEASMRVWAEGYIEEMDISILPDVPDGE